MRWWVVGVLAAVLAVTACTMDAPEQSGDKTTDAVSISGFAFKPGTTRNVTGVEITFTNRDSTTHNITFTSQPDGADLDDSSNFGNGAHYSVTPVVAGTYQYECTRHSNMTGTLIITAP